MRLSIPLCVATSVILAASVTAASPSPREASVFAGPDLFNLDFPGGTVEEYAAAIRAEVENVNLVIMPNAANLDVPAVTLRSVEVGGALSFLHERRFMRGDETVEISLDFHPGNMNIGELDVHTIVAYGNVSPTRTTVVSVEELLQGMSQDDLLSAVEVSLEMFSENYPGAKIKFHAESSILLVKGHTEQVGIVEEMLGELLLSARRRAAQEKNEQSVSALIMELNAATGREEGLRSEMNQIRLQLSEWAQRYNLLDQESQRLRDKLAQEEGGLQEFLHRFRMLETQISESEPKASNPDDQRN